METKIITQSETEVQFSVTLTEIELNKHKSEVYDHLRTQVKAAGFRPGKAPDTIVERELGSSVVQGEFIEHVIQHTYAKAVQEQKLAVISSPKIALDKFVPYTELEYKATVELMPKVKLADYTKFRVKRPAVKVESAEIDQTVADLRRRESTRLDSEHPAKKGDEVNFDFSGTKDGQAVPGASAKGQTLQLGSGRFIPGFEEELIGLSKDDEKTFDIRFPKDYHEKTLADQVVTFAVKINSVTDLVLPELNEEFVGKVSPFKTVDELRANISERINAQKAEEAARAYEKEVLDKLIKESKFTAPKALVEQQMQRMKAELEQNLAYSGLNLEKYLEVAKKTMDEIESELKPEAERRVALAMLLTEVAAQEGLTVPAAELDAEIARLKAEYADPATQAELDNPDTREEVYNHLMASKVIGKLLGYAEGK